MAGRQTYRGLAQGFLSFRLRRNAQRLFADDRWGDGDADGGWEGDEGARAGYGMSSHIRTL